MRAEMELTVGQIATLTGIPKKQIRKAYNRAIGHAAKGRWARINIERDGPALAEELHRMRWIAV